MESLDLYTISFKGISLGSHVFDWKIDDKFFAMYEMSEISDADVIAQVTLLKHTRFMELDFLLNGWVEVACSRCLDPLKLEMASKAKMYVKFGSNSGENDAEEDTDIVILHHGEDRLNIAQYLYEYAHLNLPIRRVHPDDANGQSRCNAEMIKKLEQFLVKTNNT